MKIQINILFFSLFLVISLQNVYAQMAISTGRSMDMSIQNSYEVIAINVDANINNQLAEEQ